MKRLSSILSASSPLPSSGPVAILCASTRALTPNARHPQIAAPVARGERPAGNRPNQLPGDLYFRPAPTGRCRRPRYRRPGRRQLLLHRPHDIAAAAGVRLLQDLRRRLLDPPRLKPGQRRLRRLSQPALVVTQRNPRTDEWALDPWLGSALI